MTPFAAPVRLSPSDDMAPVLRLIQSAFAGMNGRIDPPSSMYDLTPASIADQAGLGAVWVVGARPDACVFLTPQADHLYIGKLATRPGARGRGFAYALMAHAARRAKALRLPSLILETRIELTENQSFFRALGFQEIGRSAHPGYDRPTSICFAKGVAL